MELWDTLLSFGYSVSPTFLQILVSKYDKTALFRGIDCDNFIECSLVVKGLVTFIVHFTGGSSFKGKGDCSVAEY
jgi:hypothetical protein